MKASQALYVDGGNHAVGKAASINEKSNNPQAEVWGIGKSKL
jgi:hypothetical protein